MKAIVALVLLLFVLVDCEGQTARNFRRVNFSNLGSPASKNETRSCPDCTVGDPCTGGGTGAYAYASPTGDRWICTNHAPGGGGGGGVSSVALSLPNIFNVSGSPVTTSGTLTAALASQSANRIFAGPTTGSAAAPSFRPLVAADLGSGTADNTKFLRGDLTWQTGVGTVTSVALGTPVEFTVSGSPITGSGTLSFTKANQSANLVYAGPSSGSAAQPGFRSLVANDLPSIAEAKFLFSDILTANASTVMHGLMPKLSGNGADCFRGDGSWVLCPSGGGGGSGDFSTNTTTSVANQVVVASGTGGKTGTFASGSGVGIFTLGVLSFKANPTGAFVGDTDPQTLGNKTLTTPTIASFANATHNHTNAGGGGQLAMTAFSSTTGSGAVVGQTAPSLVTPNIGAATATSINKVAITTPATSATLTVDNGKTFRAANSITIAGTDGTTLTGPSGSGTLLTTDSTASVSNKTFVLPIVGSNAGLPGTCTVGQEVRNSSDSRFYKCYATDSWGEILVAGASGIVSTSNGGTGAASPSGTVTISGATSGSTNFPVAYSNAPNCVVTPRSDVGSGVRFWATATTAAITVQTSSSVSVTFSFVCMGAPN